MLVEVHGLVVLQLVKPTPKMRAHARDAINTMIDKIMMPQGEGRGDVP
jgi:hypothetical protein